MPYKPRRALLVQDAGNRALRTFLQGLAYVILLAVGLVLYNAFVAADGWGSFDWHQLAFSAIQAGVTAGFAYVMRKNLDPSNIPTPLPPEHPGEPNDDV
jgi:ABC-type proline/glycine betaine transport system permease subunit